MVIVKRNSLSEVLHGPPNLLVMAVPANQNKPTVSPTGLDLSINNSDSSTTISASLSIRDACERRRMGYGHWQAGRTGYIRAWIASDGPMSAAVVSSRRSTITDRTAGARNARLENDVSNYTKHNGWKRTGRAFCLLL